MKNKRMTGLLLVAMTAIFLGGCAKETPKAAQTEIFQEESAEENEESDRLSSLVLGEEPAVEFEATDLEGNQVTSDIFGESKLTMVNVWATYCNPCLSEMPGLGELAAEYDPSEFQIIGIVSDAMEGGEPEMADQAADLVEQTGADYPHLLLNLSLYDALLTDVTAVPTTFFINENGEILDTVIGSMEKSAWREKIDGLLEDL